MSPRAGFRRITAAAAVADSILSKIRSFDRQLFRQLTASACPPLGRPGPSTTDGRSFEPLGHHLASTRRTGWVPRACARPVTTARGRVPAAEKLEMTTGPADRLAMCNYLIRRPIDPPESRAWLRTPAAASACIRSSMRSTSGGHRHRDGRLLVITPSGGRRPAERDRWGRISQPDPSFASDWSSELLVARCAARGRLHGIRCIMHNEAGRSGRRRLALRRARARSF